MVMTVGASWLVGSSHQIRRHAGFWVFLLSNAMWVFWGLYHGAPALIALQVVLATMNIRSAIRTDKVAWPGRRHTVVEHSLYPGQHLRQRDNRRVQIEPQAHCCPSVRQRTDWKYPEARTAFSDSSG